MTKNYDVIIIGGGLSGLIAGCYLSKNGVKALIIEKNQQLGGYCSSFSRKGFTFDSAAHSLGSCREDGQFGRIFSDFNISDRVIKRANPSDVVIRKRQVYFIPNGVNNIIKEFQKKFPKEKNSIKCFFNMINDFDINSTASCMMYYRKFSAISFQDLLDSYFSNNELKLVLATFLGNTGLPANYVSCLAALGIFKEFVLDGGYYLKGGMQKIANLFGEIFNKNNGHILLSNKVKKIELKNCKVVGVALESGQFFPCKYVITASDARTAFFNLIGKENLDQKTRLTLNKMVPSVSAFIVYLGVKKPINNIYNARTYWHVPDGDINKYYKETFNGHLNLDSRFLVYTFPGIFDNTLAPQNHSTIQLYTVAPFISNAFWIRNKEKVATNLIKRFNKIIGNISSNIYIKDSASPLTFLRYTNNYNGACYGWASTIKQSSGILMRPKTCIDGLYLTGHWTTFGAGQGGTPMAAYAGRITAQLILKRLSKNIGVPIQKEL